MSCNNREAQRREVVLDGHVSGLEKNIVSAETLEAMTQVELTPFESARIDHFHNHPSGDGKGDAAVISEEGAQVAWNRITAWDGYVLTPPVRLPGLGTALGVAEVMFKDAGGRGSVSVGSRPSVAPMPFPVCWLKRWGSLWKTS
jgi:hypothetical protein